MRVYVSSMRQLQISKGLPNRRVGGMAKLSQFLKGIRLLSTGVSRVRLPITPHILTCIKDNWETNWLNNDRTIGLGHYDTVLFRFFLIGWDMCTTNWTLRHWGASLFLKHHSNCDGNRSPQQLEIHLKQSKTDQEGDRSTVWVGKTGHKLCPVAATLLWMVYRGNISGPLFRYTDGSALTQQLFIVELQRALLSIGEDPHKYGGHSFRIGAATVAAEQGINDAIIKLLGCWYSSAYQRYVRPSLASLARHSRTCCWRQSRLVVLVSCISVPVDTIEKTIVSYFSKLHQLKYYTLLQVYGRNC